MPNGTIGFGVGVLLILIAKYLWKTYPPKQHFTLSFVDLFLGIYSFHYFLIFLIVVGIITIFLSVLNIFDIINIDIYRFEYIEAD